MKTVKPKKLTLESFHKYGTFIKMNDPGGVKFAGEGFEFYPDKGVLTLPNTNPSFSTLRVFERPFVTKALECHTYTGEAIMPLDGDVYVHIAHATGGDIPYDEIEVFRVPKDTMLILRPGVWHHAPFPIKKKAVNVLICLPERLYANDLVCVDIPADKQLKIEG